MAAVLVLATVFVAANVITQPALSMASPPLLDGVPIDGTTRDILDRLSVTAGNHAASTSAAERSTSYETWSANITMDGGTVTDVFVQPQEVERTWADDLSGRIIARAGVVKWGAETGNIPAAKPGTVLNDGVYRKGEYPAIFTGTPPTTEDGLRTYLALPLGLTEQSTAGEWFRAIQDLRADWPLDGAQNAALLKIVAALPDVSVAGTITDRLGRSGVAVETESRADGTFRDVLIFDTETGLLISAEEVYLGGLEDINLPAMTVLNYTAWKDTK